MSTPNDSARANRLAKEKSPYLRQHALNPVDWYPWGEEALRRAEAEDLPILLSVGYSACHWCHVMAHESFENPAVAARMNAGFVNIKVDREERPDLDQLYQGVVALMGQGGGWPLTVFLTPDLRPFFGGTYFPPEDRYGRPGFPRVLEGLRDAWTAHREEVEAQAERFRAGLEQTARFGTESEPSAPSPDDLLLAARKLLQDVDPVFGGFGGAPKFPNPSSLSLMLRAHRRAPPGEKADSLRDAVMHGLEQMAKGGLFDQLGGGFHRYTVDRAWRVPHFEKMLYDNAQLLHLYAEAQQLAPRPLWGEVAEATCAWLEREMTAPGGGFFAALDADSDGEEGKFFVWAPAELDEVLSARQAEICKLRFEVTPEGNFEGGRTVLAERMPVSEIAQKLSMSEAEVGSELATARTRLFEARERRVRPGLDDKLLAGWNGLMIRGLAFAGRVFNRPEWVRSAEKCAGFVLEKLWDGERLLRVSSGAARIDGFLEDYGHLASGLVALYQATFEPRWLVEAEALANRAVTRFWDEETSAYRTAPKGRADLLVPTFALHDGATPSGASTLAEAQVALAALTGRTAHLEQADRYLRKLRNAMVDNPFGFGHLLLAADALLEGASALTLVASDAELPAWTRVLGETYAPTVAVCRVDPEGQVPEVISEEVQGRGRVGGKSAAYLCRDFVCGLPLTEPGALKSALTRSG